MQQQVSYVNYQFVAQQRPCLVKVHYREFARKIVSLNIVKKERAATPDLPAINFLAWTESFTTILTKNLCSPRLYGIG